MFSRILNLLSPLQWLELAFLIIVISTAITTKNELVDWVETKFGMETKANLKEKVINQGNIIKDQEDTNKELNKTLDNTIASNKVTNKAIVSKFTKESKIDNTNNLIFEKKIKDISKIEEDFSHKAVTTETTAEKEKEISTIQINALWSVYCTDPGNSERCTTNKA